MTLHQFTQPIHDTPIGDVIVLPPRWSDDVAYAASLEGAEQWMPAVGDEAEVVERCEVCEGRGWNAGHVCGGDEHRCAVRCPEQERCERCHWSGWRRVAFVRVRRVLTIYDAHTLVDVGLPDEWIPHVTIDGPRCSAWFPNNPYCSDDWDEYTLDLPTAEPGGLVVVVERIECPTCEGRKAISRHLVRPGVVSIRTADPCPTCTTPPEVTT
jgi:hypothetical protein